MGSMRFFKDESDIVLKRCPKFRVLKLQIFSNVNDKLHVLVSSIKRQTSIFINFRNALAH